MDAVVLLSGGIDSSVTAYLAKGDIGNGRLHALSFEYGQRHERELECASRIGEILKVATHPVFSIKGLILLGSALTGGKPIPEGEQSGIPVTWVPQRNSIFLAVAFGYAEAVGADLVYIGVNSVDYSGYPDCRPEFIQSVGESLNLASKRFVEAGKRTTVVAPLQYLSKVSIIKIGLRLGVPFQDTWSCYKGGEKACGKCPSCLIRLDAFYSLGVKDPIEYEVLYG